VSWSDLVAAGKQVRDLGTAQPKFGTAP